MNALNKKLVSRRFFLGLILLSTISMVAISGLTRYARADVADILKIENISQDSIGKVRLEIRHSNPSSGHYINTVEIDIDGQIKEINLQPQDSNPFVVDFDLGEIQGTPNVRARANCNLHGWSAWSDQIEIPEFPNVMLAILAALTTLLLITKNMGNARKTIKSYEIV